MDQGGSEEKGRIMLPELTRDYIVASFKSLVIEKPFHRITVLDITRRARINKNTFYYHFEDRSDLVRATFRLDFGDVLESNFPHEALVYGESGDKYKSRPFYLDTRSRAANLDLSEFFGVMNAFLAEHKQIYANLLSSNKPGSLAFYLHDLYYPQMRQDLLFALGDDECAESDVNFLANYFTSSCFGCLTDATLEKNHYSFDVQLQRDYNNITHELMRFYVSRDIPR
jgi:AcrR family transcriptional regulator